MKKLIFLIFAIAFSSSIAQTACDFTTDETFSTGDTVHLLFDKVNLRTEPDSSSKIIQKLDIESRLKIKSKSDETYTSYGFIHNWFEVVLLDKTLQETNIKGYLWGGFFAYDTFESINDPGVKFLFGLSKIKQEDWGEYSEYQEESPNQWGKVPIFQIRAVMEGKEIARLDFKGIGVIGVPHHTNIIGNKGLRNVNDIIKINFSSNYCGGYFGNIYVFWDRAILHHAKTLYEGADAPVYTERKFIFPDDEGGKPRIIIFHEEAGSQNDDGTVDYDYQRDTKLIWTGCEFKETK